MLDDLTAGSFSQPQYVDNKQGQTDHRSEAIDKDGKRESNRQRMSWKVKAVTNKYLFCV